jgi:flagellar biosynthesis GTPase FlhF
MNPKIAGGIDLSSLIVIVVVLLTIGVAVFFANRGSTLKSQLKLAQEDANKQTVQLQSQIDAAAAKVREATDQLPQLQSQADQARAEAATAKASAEKASRQTAELQVQLDQARREAADAKAKAEKNSAEAAKLRAQLEAQVTAPPPDKPAQAEQPAPVKPEASNLKQLPLNVAFKKAPMLDNNALAIQNTSTAGLSLTVRFSNPAASKEFQVALEPGAAKEIGWLGAWVLASGDKIEIKSAGYETIVKTAP